MIDMRRQLAPEPCYFVPRAEFRKFRRRYYRLRQPRPRRIHVHPHVAVSFLTGKTARADPLHPKLVVACQRWNLHAAPAARIELPAVITALHVFSIEVPIGKRDAAVRAGI